MQTIWLTGRCQSGKTTLAAMLEDRLVVQGHDVQVIDGDTIRDFAPTGFDETSVDAHLRRMAITARFLNHRGVYVIVSCISPLRETRLACRKIVGKERFTLVYVSTPSDVCASIDTKNIYGNPDIKNIAGVDAPFDDPGSDENSIWYEWHTFPGKHYAGNQADCIVRTVHDFRSRPAALFIGRWQSLRDKRCQAVDKAIEIGQRVVIAVRGTPVDESNPLTHDQVCHLIYRIYGNDVEIIQIPDFDSVYHVKKDMSINTLLC